MKMEEAVKEWERRVYEAGGSETVAGALLVEELQKARSEASLAEGQAHSIMHSLRRWRERFHALRKGTPEGLAYARRFAGSVHLVVWDTDRRQP